MKLSVLFVSDIVELNSLGTDEFFRAILVTISLFWIR
jgi:hypothetical protein